MSSIQRRRRTRKEGVVFEGEGKLPSCNDVTVKSNSRIKEREYIKKGAKLNAS